MLKVCWSISTKTGVAPSRAITSAVAMKVNGGGQDGVAWPDIEGHERHEECVGSAGTADAVFYADVGGEFFLELGDFGAQDVGTALEYCIDALSDIVLDARVLCF